MTAYISPSSPTCPGDQVSRRGALTGGYYDTRKSRLDLQKSKMECLQQLQQQEKDYEQHKGKLQDILALLSEKMLPSVEYRQTSDISCTKSQNLNVSRLSVINNFLVD